MSRLAQLVERKTLNLVVVGSSPTVGVAFCLFLFRAPARSSRDGGRAFRSYLAPVAQLAARRSHNPKVASSILAGSIVFLHFFVPPARFGWSRVGCLAGATAFGWMAERSKALV